MKIEDSQIDKRYKELPPDAPSHLLDNSILNLAKSTAAQHTGKTSSLKYWPSGLAASVVLVLLVFFLLPHNNQESTFPGKASDTPLAIQADLATPKATAERSPQASPRVAKMQYSAAGAASITVLEADLINTANALLHEAKSSNSAVAKRAQNDLFILLLEYKEAQPHWSVPQDYSAVLTESQREELEAIN